MWIVKAVTEPDKIFVKAGAALFMLCWIYGFWNVAQTSKIRRDPGRRPPSLLEIISDPDDPARCYAIRQLVAMAAGVVIWSLAWILLTP